MILLVFICHGQVGGLWWIKWQWITEAKGYESYYQFPCCWNTAVAAKISTSCPDRTALWLRAALASCTDFRVHPRRRYLSYQTWSNGRIAMLLSDETRLPLAALQPLPSGVLQNTPSLRSQTKHLFFRPQLPCPTGHGPEPTWRLTYAMTCLPEPKVSRYGTLVALCWWLWQSVRSTAQLCELIQSQILWIVWIFEYIIYIYICVCVCVYIYIFVLMCLIVSWYMASHILIWPSATYSNKLVAQVSALLPFTSIRTGSVWSLQEPELHLSRKTLRDQHQLE